MKNILLFAATIVVLISCATNYPSTKQKLAIYADFLKLNQIEKQNKITAFRYQDWHSLDNQHLIVNASTNTAYLISLDGSCTDLIYANSIAIKQSTPRNLLPRFDYILVPEVPHQKCFIKSLHRLTNEQVESLEKLVKDNP